LQALTKRGAPALAAKISRLRATPPAMQDHPDGLQPKKASREPVPDGQPRLTFRGRRRNIAFNRGMVSIVPFP